MLVWWSELSWHKVLVGEPAGGEYWFEESVYDFFVVFYDWVKIYKRNFVVVFYLQLFQCFSIYIYKW
jgi:hypothetical protein